MPHSYEQAQQAQRARNAKAARIRHQARRIAAIEAYGGHCASCGESDWDRLQIVPKRGYRWGLSNIGKPIRGSSGKLAWLEAQNFPGLFQLVCSSSCRVKLNHPPNKNQAS